MSSDYFALREKLLPNSQLIFSTDEGIPLQKYKFVKHVNTLLREAGGNPIKLSEPITKYHLACLISLRFAYQRQRYQKALAIGFLGHNACRPGEIVAIRVRDIDMDQENIRLIMPKAGHTQYIHIPSEMLAPLSRFIQHLKSDDFLFVHPNNTPWQRRDVYRVTGDFAESLGLHNVYPRRMRPTVAQELKKNGASLDDVREYLRQRDSRTTLLYYAPDDVDSRRATYERYHPLAHEDWQ
jgi:integrase